MGIFEGFGSESIYLNGPHICPVIWSHLKHGPIFLKYVLKLSLEFMIFSNKDTSTLRNLLTPKGPSQPNKEHYDSTLYYPNACQSLCDARYNISQQNQMWRQFSVLGALKYLLNASTITQNQ